ncbi:unnamed protein product [Tilletia caries]|uniref:Uncharacterized protein n=1 Tax=Tilletia caries TaxID=13290 RepID=A0ABN7IXP5_9BASI|nr:unnamed protein product [Tilletia caries]CAD7060432.1 unnamed protein product [Tilletia caries]
MPLPLPAIAAASAATRNNINSAAATTVGEDNARSSSDRFLCGIGAGVLIALGGKKTTKTDEVEVRLRAAFAEREREYLERKRRVEGSSSDEDDAGGDDGGESSGDEGQRERAGIARSTTVSQLEAAVAAGTSTSAPIPSSSAALYHLNQHHHPSPVRPVAHRGLVQPLDDGSGGEDDDGETSKEEEEEEGEFVPDANADGIALTPLNPSSRSTNDDQPSTVGPEAGRQPATSPSLSRTGALSSLQHFEDRLAFVDGSASLQQAEAREEERTQAGVATAVFGLGGMQGVKDSN